MHSKPVSLVPPSTTNLTTIVVPTEYLATNTPIAQDSPPSYQRAIKLQNSAGSARISLASVFTWGLRDAPSPHHYAKLSFISAPADSIFKSCYKKRTSFYARPMKNLAEVVHAWIVALFFQFCFDCRNTFFNNY